jgi:hypothetical protein
VGSQVSVVCAFSVVCWRTEKFLEPPFRRVPRPPFCRSREEPWGTWQKEEGRRGKEEVPGKRLLWWCYFFSHGRAPLARLLRTGAALHVVTPLSQLAMTGRRPPGRHILFCHSAQRGLRRPPRPPCLGPYRAQIVQCWSIDQCSVWAPPKSNATWLRRSYRVRRFQCHDMVPWH